MKNRTQLLSSILLMALCCFFQFAKAQIVYTDVNPDVINPASYSLDLNNDGTADYSITKTSSSQCCKTCYFNSNNTSIALNLLNGSSVATANGLPAALDSGATISASGNTWSTSSGVLRSSHVPTIWSGGTCHPSGLTTYTGNWTTTKYLGLRFTTGGSTYYGWARLTVSSASSFTVHDYAFNIVANQSILAGQTCPPQASIIAGGPITFCAGDSVILSSANAGTNLSYKWKLNGSNISNATNKNYTAKVVGKYKVNVTDNTNGCSTTSALVKVKVPCRMINENLNADENILACYPNPFSQSTTISFSLSQSENACLPDRQVSLKIFDVEGRLIRMLANENMSVGEHTLNWDARDENGNEVSAGIYLLRLQSRELAQTIRLNVLD